MTPELMEHWVIYAKPRVYPEWPYVVCRWEIRCNGEVSKREAHGATTLRDARSAVPADRVRIERIHGDDPSIVEVWI